MVFKRSSLNKQRLGPAPWWRLWWHSLTYQASWNFTCWQSLGFCYLVAPGLAAIYAQPDQLRQALSRHLASFNTHPYFAPMVAGVCLRLEAQAAAGQPGHMSASEFKALAAAPLAAMGDSFFWGGWRSLCAAAGVTAAVCGQLWAPVLLLVLFNLPSLILRLLGPVYGYHSGVGIIKWVQSLHLSDAAYYSKGIAACLLGGAAALAGTISAFAPAVAENTPGWWFWTVPLWLLPLRYVLKRWLQLEWLLLFLLLVLVVVAYGCRWLQGVF